MDEGKPTGMETQPPLPPSKGFAIELVAGNRQPQPLGMGTVNAQLMGAPGVGNEQDTCPPVLHIYYIIIGGGSLAVVAVHKLARPVHEVGTQGKADDPLPDRGNAIEQRTYSLLTVRSRNCLCKWW